MDARFGLEGPTSSRRRPLVLSMLIFLLSVAGILVVTTGPVPGSGALSSSAQLAAGGLAAAAGIWWCARRPNRRRRLMAGGALLWWLGDLSWAVSLGLGSDWITVNGLLSLGAVACLTAAQVPSVRRLRAATIRSVLDGLLYGLVAAFLTWAATPTATDYPFGIFTILLCVLNGLFLSFSLLRIHQDPPAERWANLLLLASGLVLTVQHGVHAAISVADSWTVGTAWDLLWILASSLRAGALMLAIRADRHRSERPATEPRPPSAAERGLPMVVVAVGMTQALVLDTSNSATTGVGLGMIACLVARQVAAEREQRVLRQRLSTAAVELKRRADRDPLTNLHHRAPLISALHAALADTSRDPAGLLFLDVDHFKNINDRLGHSVGDQVLLGISRALTAASCPADVVARLGGDEFVVLRPRLDSDPNRWAELIRSRLEQPISVAGGFIRVTVSVGVVTSRPGIDTPDSLLARGDGALYRAKRAGRNRTEAADPIGDDLRPEIGRVTRVLSALDRRELGPYYQPIVSLADDRVVGAEALCRWTNPDGTVTEAPDFLPDLLAAGRASEITELMLSTVCRDFATGVPAERGWTVAVNLSAEELANPAVIDQFARILAATGMPPHRLHVEIDERTEPTGAAARVLTGLEALGVRLVLDDFGAGWSTFGQLVRLAPVGVKLDRSLIDPAGVSDDTQPLAGSGKLAAQLLVESFVRVSHHLGMSVVAEGIEMEEQRTALRELGCEYGQGYLWSRPVPLPDLLCWSDRRTNRCPEAVAEVTGR